MEFVAGAMTLLICTLIFNYFILIMLKRKNSYKKLYQLLLFTISYFPAYELIRNSTVSQTKIMYKASDLLIWVVIIWFMSQIWKFLYPFIVSHMVLNHETLGITKNPDKYEVTAFGELFKGGSVVYEHVQKAEKIVIKPEYQNHVYIKQLERNEHLNAQPVAISFTHNKDSEQVKRQEKPIEKVAFIETFDLIFAVRFGRTKGLSANILQLSNISPLWNSGRTRSYDVILEPKGKAINKQNSKI